MNFLLSPRLPSSLQYQVSEVEASLQTPSHPHGTVLAPNTSQSPVFYRRSTRSLYIFSGNINIQGGKQNVLRLEGLNSRLRSPQAPCGAPKADSLLVTAQPRNPSDMCNQEGI